MEVREELKEIIERARAAAEAAGELPRGEYAPVQRLEIPKAKEFGDYSTNAAMQWARTAHKAPRAIAESIVKYIDAPLVSKMEIAGAGFINFFLAADTVYAELRNILSAGASYGDFPKDKKDKILVPDFADIGWDLLEAKLTAEGISVLCHKTKDEMIEV